MDISLKALSIFRISPNYQLFDLQSNHMEPIRKQYPSIKKKNEISFRNLIYFKLDMETTAASYFSALCVI